MRHLSACGLRSRATPAVPLCVPANRGVRDGNAAATEHPMWPRLFVATTVDLPPRQALIRVRGARTFVGHRVRVYDVHRNLGRRLKGDRDGL